MKLDLEPGMKVFSPTEDYTQHKYTPEEIEASKRYQARRQAKIEAYIATPRPSEEVEYIVAAARSALAAEPPDWNTCRAALWAAKAGMREDPRLLPIARDVMTRPRGEKISDAHWLAILDALELLGYHNSQEAMELLIEATTGAFWAPYPLRSRSFHAEPERAVFVVRLRALLHIAQAPAALSVPALLRLVKDIPDMATPAPVPPANAPFEESIAYQVQKALKEIDERGGGPAPARF